MSGSNMWTRLFRGAMARGSLKRRPSTLLFSWGTFAAVAVIFCVLFIGPFVRLTAIGLSGGGHALSEVLASNVFRQSLLRTLRFSVIVTSLDVVIGFPVAYILARSAGPRLRSVLYLLIVSPLLISLVVRTLGWMILLDPRGPIDATLNALDLPSVRLIYNDWGVIIGMTQVLLPFAVLPMSSALRNVDQRALEAASSLGAKPSKVFRRIILPLSMPGIGSASVLVFTLTMSGYVTPILLGGPRAGNFVAALIANDATVFDALRQASAASLILVVALVPFLIGHRYLEGRLGKYGRAR